MGNFFCINKVSPGDTVDQILSAGHRSRNSRPGTALGYERDETEMIRQLQDEGIVPRVREGGVSFEVDLGQKQPQKRPPRRLTELPNRPVPGSSVYNSDEKQLIANILRQEQIANRKMQARIADERIFNAKGKRYLKEAEKRAKVKAKLEKKKKGKNAEERKKNLKDLAINAKDIREQAAKKKEE